jgi:hypothetical protein
MRIQIDRHTLERAEERGTSEEEITDVLETGFEIPGKHGRVGKAKVYEFKKERHGRKYEQKRVEVIYIKEKELVRMFHELLSRDHEDGRATWQPQGVDSEPYLNGTSQVSTPEDARLPARRAYSSERRTAISVVAAGDS